MSGSGPVRDEETLARYVLSGSWLYKDERSGIVNWPPLTGNKKHDEAGQLVLAMKLLEHAGFVPAV